MKKRLIPVFLSLFSLVGFSQTTNTVRQVVTAGTAITRLPSPFTPTVSPTDTVIVFQSPTWKKTTVSGLVGSSVGSFSWLLLGNSGTVDGTNFLGTTDDLPSPMNFRVANIPAGRIESDVTSGNTFYGSRSGTNTLNGVPLSGVLNTAIGFGSLFNNIGSSNTGIGFEALFTNSTGGGNTSVGESSLYFNTLGGSNTAYGSQSLRGNTTGSNNTGVGFQSGVNHITGDNNTFIGYIADGTSGISNSTAIGANSVVTASNSMVLGASGVNVGINTTAPTEKLHVVGNAIITGKLTVGGAIDPTSVLLSGGTALFYESNNGNTAPVSGASTGRLRYNNTTGTWQKSTQGSAYTDIGSGTVTSVSGSGGTTGLTLTGGPITTSGTLTLGGTLAAVNGGTGFAAYSVGALLSANTTSTLSQISAVAVGQMFISNGTNTLPSWSGTGVLNNSLTTPILYGSSSASGNLILSSTSNATKGNITIGGSYFDQNLNRVGIGFTAGSTALLEINSGSTTVPPLRFNSGTVNTSPLTGSMEYDGTNLFFTNGLSTRYQVARVFTGSASLNFANLASIGCEDLTMTVTGAADGDEVSLGVPNGSVVANSSYSAWVSAANTVTVRFCTFISGDPATGTFQATVIKN